MKKGPLWQIAVCTSLEAEEAAAALLERLFGQPAVSFTSMLTHRATVMVYSSSAPAASKRAALESGLQHLQTSGLQTENPEIIIRNVRREDWAESWKKFFHPIEIGSALLIRASWSRRAARKGQRVIELDPGLSFGTGQHATTAFCLQQIVQHRAGGSRSMLDLGTGSGILALAAGRLGYAPVLAIDNDPVAVRIAEANVRKNRLAGRVTVQKRDLAKLGERSRRTFDLVCANLTDDLLLEWRSRIINRLAPGGVLVLAGMLKSQFARVRQAYETAGLGLLENAVEEEWQSGAFSWTP
jgi:ribosomal protein L11 methyltransferase